MSRKPWHTQKPKTPRDQRGRARHSMARTKEYLREYKRTHPCVDCGEDDWRCLAFDHRDRATKCFNLGDYNRHSFEDVIAEIAKCDIRCHNCHAKKTIEETSGGTQRIELWEREQAPAAPIEYADWELT